MKGILVTDVLANSEAQKVGILVGDIILEYNKENIYGNFSYLLSLFERHKKKESVKIRILRGDDTLFLEAKGGDLGIKGDTTAIKSEGKSEINRKENAEDSYHFKTLLGYGKFISGFGWVVIIVGAIVFLIGIANMRDFEIMAILGGIITLIMGIGLVANGQLISCFVSIERNTRKINQLLESKGT